MMEVLVKSGIKSFKLYLDSPEKIECWSLFGEEYGNIIAIALSNINSGDDNAPQVVRSYLQNYAPSLRTFQINRISRLADRYEPFDDFSGFPFRENLKRYCSRLFSVNAPHVNKRIVIAAAALLLIVVLVTQAAVLFFDDNDDKVTIQKESPTLILTMDDDHHAESTCQENLATSQIVKEVNNRQPTPPTTIASSTLKQPSHLSNQPESPIAQPTASAKPPIPAVKTTGQGVKEKLRSFIVTYDTDELRKLFYKNKIRIVSGGICDDYVTREASYAAKHGCDIRLEYTDDGQLKKIILL